MSATSTTDDARDERHRRPATPDRPPNSYPDAIPSSLMITSDVEEPGVIERRVFAYVRRPRSRECYARLCSGDPVLLVAGDGPRTVGGASEGVFAADTAHSAAPHL
jgi:hypothetical protein